MSNISDTKLSKEEELTYALEMLNKSKESSEDFRFNFACFVDSFKRYLEKSKLL